MALDSEIEEAAKTLNDSIFIMETLDGNPKEHINGLVESWYARFKADGFSEDECNECVVDAINFITEAKYQKIAQTHLLKINRDNNSSTIEKVSENRWLNVYVPFAVIAALPLCWYVFGLLTTIVIYLVLCVIWNFSQ